MLMTFADDMRKKAEHAQKMEIIMQDEFDKKTRRLATSRYLHVTQLIEGAASNGKLSLEFPSTWEQVISPATVAVFDDVAEQLRKQGFLVSIETQEAGLKNLVHDKQRLCMIIAWS